MSVVVFLNQVLDKRDEYLCFTRTWMRDNTIGKEFQFYYICLYLPPLNLVL